ncbi:hypothetical protein NT6N_28760 [Oceaniferula spumae]|uniref:SnoaL-like domain-containing protein n=1 Tax=Oceaniferula spumae TaxID=2979115 RepID=A0AAT9FPA9_9BACT
MNNHSFVKIEKHKHSSVMAWLAAFQKCVQEQDYEAGMLLFDEQLVSFGTVTERSYSLDHLVDSQWTKVWGATKGFRFHLEDTYLLGDEHSPTVVVATQWSSTSRCKKQQLRSGRCTIALVKNTENDAPYLAVHTHFSVVPDGRVTQE